MWIAFDKVKLMICRDNPDGSIDANFCRPGDNVLERAQQTGARPLIANVHDVDDKTHKVKETWKNCLVAGKDEATTRKLIAGMFGEDWAYTLWGNGRFLLVEVPDDQTFGYPWICDRPDAPPRAALEA